ncbi:hypothetical protein [Billgrantia montanilacus]|uniref:Uncharacterized protein n=1 Tax=Billgrantia montanilacus TaxID=2282305 RepID=A0A368TYP1_9GAMM|nr:hypothetical protein [Halomonas montanilacus]RCV89854.1 hypothetical protein DU505_09735 [Halomonas montanilacus]
MTPHNRLSHELPLFAAAGGPPALPDGRLADTLTGHRLAQDDIVRRELRNDVMLAGDRTAQAATNRVTPGEQQMPQRR